MRFQAATLIALVSASTVLADHTRGSRHSSEHHRQHNQVAQTGDESTLQARHGGSYGYHRSFGRPDTQLESRSPREGRGGRGGGKHRGGGGGRKHQQATAQPSEDQAVEARDFEELEIRGQGHGRGGHGHGGHGRHGGQASEDQAVEARDFEELEIRGHGGRGGHGGHGHHGGQSSEGQAVEARDFEELKTRGHGGQGGHGGHWGGHHGGQVEERDLGEMEIDGLD